jgi:indole-3-acetate monooxygenase
MNTNGTLKRIQDGLPLIRSRRHEIEQARRLPQDLAQKLRQTGIFSLGLPRAIGGQEASPLEILRAIETVAMVDGSTGWCAMIGTANNVVGGYMSENGAKEVFADPTAPTAGIAAPAGAAVRTTGGVRVTGRWPFASGITHSDWVWAGCVVMANGQPQMTPQGPEIIHVCMPASTVTIHDTWNVSGLCGTGSNDFSVSDVFVPDQRIFALLDPSGHRSEPLYQMPPLGLFVFQVAAVSLGIARGAIDELMELAHTKKPSLYSDVLADKSVVQVELARAEAALGAARSFLFTTVTETWETVRSGQSVTRRQIALGRAAASHAAETAATVTRSVNTLAGGSSIYSASPLQRHARDADAITHHFTVAPHTWEEAGRVLLGRETIAPFF